MLNFLLLREANYIHFTLKLGKKFSCNNQRRRCHFSVPSCIGHRFNCIITPNSVNTAPPFSFLSIHTFMLIFFDGARKKVFFVFVGAGRGFICPRQSGQSFRIWTLTEFSGTMSDVSRIFCPTRCVWLRDFILANLIVLIL